MSIHASSSGFLPAELVSALKSELLSLEREGRTRTVEIHWRVEHGQPIEARVRSRECLRIVSLSS